MTIGERITVNGTAVLKLYDGCTLTAQKGIEVSEGKQLTINSETANTGRLIIDRCDKGQAGIGAYHVGTITINGGQVTARGGSFACGIGPGNFNEYLSGSVTLGWTDETDFIQAAGSDGNSGFSSRISTLAFKEGIHFIVEGANQVATTENIRNNCKLVPMTDEATKNLYYFPVSNFEARYQYTGSDIVVTPVMKDVDGNTLIKGTHYTTAITCNGVAAESVKAVGSYTYTFTAIGGGYTGSQSISFEVETMPAPTGLQQTAYAANSATLSWTKDDNVSQWKLQYDTDSDFSNPTEVTVNTEATTTITGLTPEVDYYVRVKAVIDEVESNWSDVTTCLASDKKWIGFGQEADEGYTHPTNAYYNFSVSEQIYTAAEIGQAGRIANIAFKMMSVESGQVDVPRALDIYMVHTDKTEFESYYDWIVPTEADKVFSGEVTFTTGNWTTINLDKPFVYNGAQDLAIIVDDNTGSFFDSYDGNDYKFLTISGDEYKTLYFRDDDKNLDPTTDLDKFYADYYSYYRSQILIGMTPALALYDTADNTAAISGANGHVADVVLSGRTLYKDGKWNTLCLPFDVTVGSGQMAGATAMTLNASTSGFDDSTGELTLNFDAVTSGNTIAAGTPFIVKWTGSDVTNPVFSGVTVSSANHDVTSTDGKVQFRGTYKSIPFDSEDKSILFLSANNTLYFPKSGTKINPFRAYFQLNGISTGDIAGTRLFFGDDETTGIGSITINREPITDGEWFSLDGRRLDGKPTQKGLYIHGGKKVVVH